MKRSLLAYLVFFSAPLIIWGCGGSTTTGGEEDFSGTSFVSTDSTTGGIDLRVTSPNIPVGGTSGFLASVFDASGQDVQFVTVACDSEQGLAILEPTSGRFVTNNFGEASGVVGCETPGSYILGCRLPTGGNKRVFAQVVCTGDAPIGFDGFASGDEGDVTGGGGLGGGALSDSGGFVITNLSIQTIGDDTGDVAPEIDTTQGVCESGEEVTAELFGDDVALISLESDATSPIRIIGVRYTVKRAQEDGTDYRSGLLRFTRLLQPGSSLDISPIIFTPSSLGGVGRKAFENGVSFIPAELGIRNVTFTVVGESVGGEEVEATVQTTMDFRNWNSCEAG